MKPKQLPQALRSLCARLAVERLRPAQWAATAELRSAVLARVRAGEPVEALADELRQAIALAAGRAATPHG